MPHQAHKEETYTVLLRTGDRVSGTTLQAPQWYVNFETVLPSQHTKYNVKAYLYGQPDTGNNTSATDTILIHLSGLPLNLYDTAVGGHGNVVGLCELYTSPFSGPEYGLRPHSQGIGGITCSRPDTQLLKLYLTDTTDTAFTPAKSFIVVLQFTPIINV